MVSETRLLQVPGGGLLYRIQDRSVGNAHPVIMLHGLGGNEDSTWVLTGAFPPGGLVVAPRGSYPLDEGGYGWLSPDVLGRPAAADFGTTVEEITRLAGHLERGYGIERQELVLLGFSQGAALAFAIAQQAFSPAAVVVLAGFLPTGDLAGLQGVPVYWGHGSQDDLVPVETAREEVAALRALGSYVTYCEAEVGHKVGLECMKGLRTWLKQKVAVPGQTDP